IHAIFELDASVNIFAIFAFIHFEGINSVSTVKKQRPGRIYISFAHHVAMNGILSYQILKFFDQSLASRKRRKIILFHLFQIRFTGILLVFEDIALVAKIGGHKTLIASLAVIAVKTIGTIF